MPGPLVNGLILVVLAGVCQGSFMLPSKGMRGWAWENYWLIFAVTAYLISPWVLASLTIKNLAGVYTGVSSGSLVAVVIFGIAWGVGAVTFGLGVDALGLALGFAVILGLATTFGTLIPLIVTPPANFTATKGAIVGVSLAIMLIGVVVCSFAGKWKESKHGGRRDSYRRGIIVAGVSGLLSACGNLGFAFGGEITRRAQQLGTPAHLAPNALWTLLTLPLFFCNAGYAIYLMRKNGTLARYRSPDAMRSLLLAVCMGVLWMAGFEFYGMGARTLGDLGPSLGWAILMSSMVLVANALGLATREWKGAPAASLRRLWLGVAILTCAIAGLGYANR